ncbi:TPA_asm: N [Vicia betacytorhabdovirus 1]|nr:TPA_asm: N [Vicia betacytorhabdovirus 1]
MASSSGARGKTSMQLKQEFADSLSVIPSDQLIISNKVANWRVDSVESLTGYHFEELCDHSIYKLCLGLLYDYEGQQFDNLTLLRILILALHLYQLNRGNRKRIFRNLKITGNNPVSSFPQGSLTRAKYKTEEGTRNGRKVSVKKRMKEDADGFKFSDYEREIKFVTTFSAYLLRFIAKGPENITSSWNNFQTNFPKLYGYAVPLRLKTPSADWISLLRAFLSNDRKVQFTWIKAIVFAEDTFETDNPDLGLLRYLAILPLSFTGLHAYKLFHDVMRETYQDPKWLLSEMLTPYTRKALLTIANILTNFESTEQGSKTVGFKYSRLISSDYFPDLQTKQCLPLVYLLAKILEYFKSYQNNTGPTNIAGLATLSPEQTTLFNLVAEKIVLALPEENKDMYSKSFTEAFYDLWEQKHNPQEAVGDDNHESEGESIFG